jgi:hypothetical protein
MVAPNPERINMPLWQAINRRNVPAYKVAPELGFTPSYLSDIMRRRRNPTKSEKEKIASHFNLPVEALFKAEDYANIG